MKKFKNHSIPAPVYRPKRDIAILSIFLIAGLASIVLFISPSNQCIIAGFISLVALTGFVCGSLFFSTFICTILAITLFLFLGINYLAGFQIINNLLLASFIIGVVILTRQK
ncbi:hypothetical protein HGA88_05850 [Candidatus Roizmanbacteria bacterium]|nr:hypothetical protein [Candidatus Roizmanbacteria bacterium]